MTDTAAPAGELVRVALRAAVRAPSPHNTQPWRFAAGAGSIDVLLDSSRVLAVCDPGAHEATLACGRRVAQRAAGPGGGLVGPHGDAAADRSRPELLGTVRLGGAHRPLPAWLRLAGAIQRRHTNRRPFLDRAVPVAVRHALATAAAEEGAQLVLLTEPHRPDALAALLRHADTVQTEDAAFRAELTAWTYSGDRDDGVPRSAGGPRALDGGLLALRDYGGGEARQDRRFESTPLVGVLTTAGDTRLDLVRAGQALQRVLLTATAEEYPQTVLRLGYGYPGAATPRGSVGDVTVSEEASP